MNVSAALGAEVVELVMLRTQRARVSITGTSMEPLLRAGMVVDIELLTGFPRIGDILLFKSGTGLVAHRYVGGGRFAFGSHNTVLARRLCDTATGVFITAGDAYPHRTEIVPTQLVVGRVCAVWSSADPDAQRIDDERFVRRGSIVARMRVPRALAVRLSAYFKEFVTLVADPSRSGCAPVFEALVAATHAFERHQYARGVTLLESVPLARMVEIARRHHASGLLFRWIEAAAAVGVEVPAELRDTFRRLRWVNALQAGRILASVADVHDRFTCAAIPHIFLKGGARLAAAEPHADLQFAGDVDVIVPPELADRALAVLHAAGYVDVEAGAWYGRFSAWLHHREPVRLPRIDVPVEVHQTLVPAPLVSRILDYAALEKHTLRVRGPVGEVDVLDPVMAAVHLAYHARDLHVWRDIVLLSQALRAFDANSRERFDAFVGTEKRDGLRLTSAIAAADAIVSDAVPRPRAVQRYLNWAALREDLPRAYAYPELLEAIIGRCKMLGLQRDFHSNFAAWMRCWARNLAMLPAILRIVIERRARS